MTVAIQHKEQIEELRRQIDSIRERVEARSVPLFTLSELTDVAIMDSSLARLENGVGGQS